MFELEPIVLLVRKSIKAAVTRASANCKIAAMAIPNSDSASKSRNAFGQSPPALNHWRLHLHYAARRDKLSVRREGVGDGLWRQTVILQIVFVTWLLSTLLRLENEPVFHRI